MDNRTVLLSKDMWVTVSYLWLPALIGLQVWNWVKANSKFVILIICIRRSSLTIIWQTIIRTHQGVSTLKPSPSGLSNTRRRFSDLKITVDWNYVLHGEGAKDDQSIGRKVDNLVQNYLAQGIISIPDDFVSVNLWYKVEILTLP
jgi:hypothetical protein